MMGWMVRVETLSVIAATTGLTQYNPALRRPGRFDRGDRDEGVPDKMGRYEILQITQEHMPLRV